MQYFVGDFDGTHFSSDQKKPLYVEYGKDFYAGIIFNNLKKRTVMMGWINNWTYANQIPTSNWRGAFSTPRELSLIETLTGMRLSQRFVDEYETLRGEEIKDITTLADASYELEIEIPTGGGINLFTSETEKTILGFRDGKLYLDRTHSGNVSFQKDFSSVESVPVTPPSDKLIVKILVDQSIIEVLSQDGLYAITDQVFPRVQHSKVELFGEAKILSAWKLNAAMR
jgi:fructan beta-fructosidase